MTSSLQARQVPMQVLNLSMERCGTASMQAALNILGYNTWHGWVYGERSDLHARWERAIDAKFYGKGKHFTKEQYDDVLGEFSATCGVPCTFFADELIAAYPDAKVILVVRDSEDTWFKSFSEQVTGTFSMKLGVALRYLESWRGHPSQGAETSRPGISMLKLFFGYFQASNFGEMDANARRIYREHNVRIRALMKEKPEQFLEYSFAQGWQPLCSFLGKDVPKDVPFPKVNEAVEFRKRMNARLKQSLDEGLWGVPSWLGLI